MSKIFWLFVDLFDVETNSYRDLGNVSSFMSCKFFEFMRLVPLIFGDYLCETVSSKVWEVDWVIAEFVVEFWNFFASVTNIFDVNYRIVVIFSF